MSGERQPGWYPSDREGFQRYWNGSEWDDVRPDPAGHRQSDVGPAGTVLGCLLFAAVMLLAIIVASALGLGGLACDLIVGAC